MLTLTIVAWLLAGTVYVANFGLPRSDQEGDRAAFITVFPAALIGVGINYDLTGSLPRPGQSLLFWLLISGVTALGLFSLVALGKLLSQPARRYGNSALRGIVAVVGFIASVLGIVGFYLDHL